MIIQTFSERSKGEKSFTYIYCVGGSSVPEWVCQRGSAGAQYTFCFREQLFLPGRGQPFSPLSRSWKLPKATVGHSAGDYWKNTMAADTSSSSRGVKARAKNEK